MNNKVKQVLVLLFVVSTLLIMIGSVSANTDNLNENLEASNTLNDDLSAVPDVDSGADKDVSNQLTISNIDEKTNGSSVWENPIQKMWFLIMKIPLSMQKIVITILSKQVMKAMMS